MKINKLWMALLAAVTLAACNSGGNNAQSQQLDATHTALTGTLASNSVKDYVNQLASVKVSNGDQRVEQLRQQLISYYSKAPVVQTVQAKGYVVDCIPFASQPALINASAADKATAVALNNKHLAAMAKAGNGIDKIAAGFDFKMTMCPESTVAIARVDPEHLAQMIKKAPPSLTKSAPVVKNDKTKLFGSSVGVDYSIYSWITLYFPAFAASSANISTVYTSFISPLPSAANTYTEPGSSDHSLNQLWWTGSDATSNFDSLEAGWVVGGYINYSLFVCATNDDYADDTISQNDFILYTDSPVTLGTPLVSTMSFTLSYTKLNNNMGYELGYQSNDVHGAVGYWPISHWHAIPTFTTFSYGSEATDFGGAGGLITVGGTITEAGTMNESGNIIQRQLPSSAAVLPDGKFIYSYTFNSNGSVTFSGTHGVSPTPTPTPSPQPTSQPSGAPFGQYTQDASAINWDGSHLSAVYNGVTTPVLNYADTCDSGAAVSVNNGILSCTSYTPGFQQIASTENYSHGYWPSSCYVQDVNVDTSLSGCSGATPQTSGASCINQVQAYCQNGSGSYVQTSFNPNGSGCYDSTNQMWNIGLNTNGQLYCPTSAKR